MAEAIVSALCFMAMFALTLYARWKRKKKLEPMIRKQRRAIAEIKSRMKW